VYPVIDGVRGRLRDGRWEGPAGAAAVFDEAELRGVDFRGARIGWFSAHGSLFEDCDFGGSTLDHASLGSTGADGGRWDGARWARTVYRRCDFTRVRLPEHTSWGNARFEQCLFDRARLRGMVATHQAEFVDCTFRGKIQDVNFWGRPTEHAEALGRRGNDFTGNDFTGAELVGVAFRHIDLRAQRFPGPPAYALLADVSQRIAAALAVIATWPDSSAKDDLARTLQWRRADALRENADTALVCASWIGDRVPPAQRAEVFALLAGYQVEKL
jgi:uncharacterized protein YjbI with pentapeptide repeats